MENKNLWQNEQSLSDSEWLLRDAARSASDDAELTLESILAEFSSRHAVPDAAAADGTPALDPLDALETLDALDPLDLLAPDAPRPVPPPEVSPARSASSKKAAPAVSAPSASSESSAASESSKSSASSAATPLSEASGAAEGVSLQELLNSTVQSVLDEERSAAETAAPQKRRRGLFSRKALRDTESLYDDPSGDRQPNTPEEPEDFFTDDFDERSTEPEASAEQLAGEYRESAAETRRAARLSLLATALVWLPLLLDHFGLMPALYREEPLLHTLPLLIAGVLVCLLGRDVFVYAAEQLRSRTVTYELLAALACLISLADTALLFLLPARAESAVASFLPVAMLGMSAALFGRSLLFTALRDTFRVAAVGEPDYLVTVTSGGAAKRHGTAAGFTRCAQKEDAASHWQTLLLPPLLASTLVFAILATAQQGKALLFIWNWSVLLTAVNMLSFPFCYSLPFSRLTRRFVRSGSALAGYVGAERLHRSNCVILTDSDLFPPGKVSLSGLNIYGEESGKVISYAATMAHASQSGLSRLFDPLLADKSGKLEPLDDLSFYEEGGVSGIIHGETVLFGTAAFFRKMHVALPSALHLKTGAFLAVDGTLIAIFTVKYTAAENVDWALHALRRSRITPVLAVRDGNITPALLKRKFGTDARALYPTISTRLALSERDGAHPYALLYREGLMPFAEVAVGGKRLIHAVRVGTLVSLLSGTLSSLLAFYLTFVGAFSALTPVSMLVYLALWALAALVEGAIVDRY